MVKNQEINGTEEIALVTPIPGNKRERYPPETHAFSNIYNGNSTHKITKKHGENHADF